MMKQTKNDSEHIFQLQELICESVRKITSVKQLRLILVFVEAKKDCD